MTWLLRIFAPFDTYAALVVLKAVVANASPPAPTDSLANGDTPVFFMSREFPIRDRLAFWPYRGGALFAYERARLW